VNCSISDIKNTVIRRLVIVLFVPFVVIGVMIEKFIKDFVLTFIDDDLMNLISAIKEAWYGK